ncbi:MAG: aspartyl protease family protein [Alphaproteobacteria bacterium]|nr:aspartyl protease family protein [Alphaproteobacteria bacterium]
MRRSLVLTIALLAGSAHAGDAPPPPATCSLPELASIDFTTMPEGMIALPGAIDGHKGGFLVDTGGLAGVVGWGTAKQLAGPIQRSNVSGVFPGGTQLDFGVFADRFDLGPLSFHRIWFLVAPDRMMDANLIGEIQPHAISDTNFEIDFLKGKFNLFGPSPCPGHDVYWTHDAYAQVPMTLDRAGHISVEAMLDGKPVTATIDTGAQNSFLSLKAAQHVFGIDAKNPGLKATGTASLNGMAGASTYRWPFASLTFEGIEVRSPDIVIYDTGNDTRDAEMVLGIGVLRQLHLYIAYDEKTLYLSAAEAH